MMPAHKRLFNLVYVVALTCSLPPFASVTAQECEWEHTFDFTVSNGGWDAGPEDLGDWESGIGWQGVFQNESNQSRINLRLTFGETYITHVSLLYSKSAGAGSGADWVGIDTEGNDEWVHYGAAGGVGTNQTRSGDPNRVLREFRIGINSGATPATTTAIAFLVEGTGTNPFTSEACPDPTPTPSPTSTPVPGEPPAPTDPAEPIDLAEFGGLVSAIFFAPFLALSALLGAAYLALAIIDLAVRVFSPDEVSRYE